MLSVRMFNAFGASLELITTGYHQNAGLPMRDTLETLFLLDLVVSSFYTVKNGERCGISLHGNKHNIHTQEGIQPRLLTGFTFPLPTAYLSEFPRIFCDHSPTILRSGSENDRRSIGYFSEKLQ
jgi:hypothetical protein